MVNCLLSKGLPLLNEHSDMPRKRLRLLGTKAVQNNHEQEPPDPCAQKHQGPPGLGLGARMGDD